MNIREIDDEILADHRTAGIVEEMVVRGQSVFGYYKRVWVEQGSGEDAVAGHLQVFDARVEGMPTVEEGDLVEVVGHGEFRVLRSEPDGSGRVMVVLGSFL